MNFEHGKTVAICVQVQGQDDDGGYKHLGCKVIPGACCKRQEWPLSSVAKMLLRTNPSWNRRKGLPPKRSSCSDGEGHVGGGEDGQSQRVVVCYS